ncbi:hypothetical protein DFP72DRAFT_867207 [Ephemerocybe angulata]|uniref:Homeobox domain-containing protein n=1 Tax=Ephemerocybe angulata TaxID=980116 RepID=A0A8H6IKC2_9AGAR|nr:hypothetical protein DFP72DRAFT_867207 [Tulosesus angulatus]
MDKEAQLWGELAEKAQSIQRLLASSPSYRPVAKSAGLVSFTFTPPVLEPITSKLIGVGLPAKLSDRLSKLYLERMNSSRQHFQTQFQKTCQALSVNYKGRELERAVRSVHSGYLRSYLSTSESIIKASVERASTHVEKYATRTSNHGTRTHFNHESVPLLEEYFRHNAYPSARDRVLLARKSMMEPRQIEVWFQNHRSRARKQGISLRKLSSHPLPSSLGLESLRSTMPLLFKTETEPDNMDYASTQRTTPFSEQQPNESPSRGNVESPPLAPDHAPAWAFPQKYDPTSNHEAFQMASFVTPFPSTFWPRSQPSQVKKKRHIATSIDDLVDLFQSKLTIQGPKTLQFAEHLNTPWNASVLTRPPSAPLLSLLNPNQPPTLRQTIHPTPKKSQIYWGLPSLGTPQSPMKRGASLRSVSSSSSLSTMVSDSDSDASYSRPVTPSNDGSPHYVFVQQEACTPPHQDSFLPSCCNQHQPNVFSRRPSYPYDMAITC